MSLGYLVQVVNTANLFSHLCELYQSAKFFCTSTVLCETRVWNWFPIVVKTIRGAKLFCTSTILGNGWISPNTTLQTHLC